MRRIVVVTLVCLLASRADAVTFTVTSTADTADSAPGDGVCLAGTVCTLRAALTEANATTGADTIQFAIPGTPPFVITPITALPTITAPLTITGPALVSNAAQVVLDGTSSVNESGLTISLGTSMACSISGIGVRAFQANGIQIIDGSCTIRSSVITQNAANGISLVSPSVPTSPTVIGGANAGDGNIITSNGNAGISVGAVGPVQIRGNFIGVRPSGTVAEGNEYGVLVGNGNDHVIDGNTISRNLTDGINVETASAIITNNKLGTDATGFDPAPNGTNVRLTTANDTTVSGNTICAALAGIVVEAGSTMTTLSGNRIGARSDGSAAAGLGNGVGITVQGDSVNTMISTNTIVGSTTVAIDVLGASTTGTTIVSNVIGRDQALAPAGNALGIRVTGAGPVVIGGTALGNTIVNSTGAAIVAPNGVQLISQNVIQDNGGLGIDLGNSGVSPNGSGLQDYPVVAAVSRYLSSTFVRGTVTGPPSSSVTVEAFSNAVCDTSGNGEGATLLGTATVATNASGVGTFLIAGAALSNGVPITTTATSAGTTTSEFSACVGVASCATITVAPDNPPGGLVGMTYSQAFTANGVTAGYTFTTTGTLPPGLTMAANGVLSGTPTTAGTYNVRVIATDQNGCGGYVDVSIKICPIISVNPATIADGTTQTNYNIMFAGSGGTGPYTYAFTGGQPIPGLTLNASTGAYTGTPVGANSYIFTLTATDANSCSGSRQYTVNVSLCDVSIHPTELPVPMTAVAYDATLSTVGAVVPVSYAISAGTLPDGLSLTGDHITGKPTTVGPSSFTVRGTGSDGCIGTRAYDLVTVCGGLTITPPSIYSGTEGVDYSMQLAATGGAPPYTFAAANLPPGIMISSTGLISGVPQGGLEQSIKVTVTDSMGCMGMQVYQLTFDPARDGGCCGTSRAPRASSLLLGLLVLLRLRRRRPR